jgi:hypothetical protein
MDGSRLCHACRTGLIADLRSLPDLYDRCGQVLDRLRSRDRSASMPPTAPREVAMASAAQAGTLHLVAYLCSTLDAAGGAPPGQSVAMLTEIALAHIDEIPQRDDAPRLTDDVAQVARSAHRVVHPESFRRPATGPRVMTS